jgi:hypothetical protein
MPGVAGTANPRAPVMNSFDDSNTHAQSTLDEVNAALRRTIRAPIGPESQLVQGDRCDTKTTLQSTRADFGHVCVTMLSVDGL